MKKIALIFSTCLAMLSCSTEDNKEFSGNPLTDSDLVLATTKTGFSDEMDINYANDIANNYDSYSTRTSNNSLTTCASVTIDNANPGEFPKTITVDFGNECNINGIVRSGTLTITLTDYVTNFGSQMTIVRGNNYYINGYKLEGTIVYENTTTNSNIPSWDRDLIGGKMTTPAGNVYTYTDSRSVQLIAGASTPTLTDNTYKAISGTRTVNRPNNTTLTSTILTPLIKSHNCAYISEGSLDLQGTFLDGVLDYGNGNCDNQATYTHVTGQVFNITL